jgi:carbonic anhydrase
LSSIRRFIPGAASEIAAGRVRVVGGIYRLADGRVDWI